MLFQISKVTDQDGLVAAFRAEINLVNSSRELSAPVPIMSMIDEPTITPFAPDLSTSLT